MRSSELALADLLHVDEQAGSIWFAGQRALLLDAAAMGLLRKQLVESFGAPAAQRVLTRFGFAHGWRMAEAMRAGFRWDSNQEWRDAGGRVHTLQGYIQLQQASAGPLSAQGATLAASYEAEQHLLHVGRARAPVCWTLCGFASGYMSRVEGRQIHVREDRCIGRGDPTCHFVGRPREQWDTALAERSPVFAHDGLDAVLQQIAAWPGHGERRLRRHTGAATRVTVPRPGLGDPIARSEAMQRALAFARRAGKVDSTVLLTGESGVGKERLARLIHDASPRSTGPLMAVDCAALAETLLESELFGHAQGAFTGAAQDRIGLLEAASGGTLFLDEVGELPPSMQVKLLRALQERQVRRVGENHSRPIDVRIVAATNRDLAREIAAGRFRADLYYRLNVIALRIPPLRERREDIVPLARALLTEAAARLGRPRLELGEPVADQLVRYGWPGNVRELENAMERATALAQGSAIELEDLPEEIRFAAGSTGTSPDVDTLAEVEKRHILAVLVHHGWNRRLAARQLGIGTATLYRKLKSYGLIAGRGAPEGSPP